MDKLQEIFKDNLELLQNKDVKELIDYCQKEYQKVVKRTKVLNDFENFVLDKCMNSNVIVKKGNNCFWTVQSILEYMEKME